MTKPTRDRVRGHGDEADGIEEYDNPLPTWWVGLFYGTIAFALVYGVEYHLVSGRSQAAEYDAALAAMPARSSPSAVTVSAAEGRAVYDANCVGCHGPELRGGVGPDLTDATWIHGGTLAEITTTINDGVPEKGMLTWGPILGPERVAQVAAFVHGAGGGR